MNEYLLKRLMPLILERYEIDRIKRYYTPESYLRQVPISVSIDEPIKIAIMDLEIRRGNFRFKVEYVGREIHYFLTEQGAEEFLSFMKL